MTLPPLPIPDPYQEASDLADALLDETGAIFDHIRDAIWGYRAATGRLPEREQVLAYVRWCRGTGQWVSGHPGRMAPPTPREVWRSAAGELELVRRSRAEGGGSRRDHALVRVGTGERAYGARSRRRCLRWIHENHPEGEWSITLPQREQARIVRAWGEARDWCRSRPHD